MANLRNVIFFKVPQGASDTQQRDVSLISAPGGRLDTIPDAFTPHEDSYLHGEKSSGEERAWEALAQEAGDVEKCEGRPWEQLEQGCTTGAGHRDYLGELLMPRPQPRSTE